MLTITYLGNSLDFLEEAFFDTVSFSFEPTVLSASTTRISIRNNSSGHVTDFLGIGLPSDPENQPLSGTMTGMEMVDELGRPVASFSGFSWSFRAFIEAIEASIDNDDDAPLNALLDLQPITVNGAGANNGMQVLLDGTRSTVTTQGTPFQDTLGGGNNNDTIVPGASNGGEVVFGSPGNDRIDFTGHSPQAWADLIYGDIAGPVQVFVDGVANTASVAKGAFGTDTLIDPGAVLRGDGLSFFGGDFDDTFTAAGGPDSWASYNGGAGADTFNITLSQDSVVRLNWRDSYTSSPSRGVIVDIGAGLATNDGYNSTDRINITDQGGLLEVRGTDYADFITGSARDERFILRIGNDTLDGGGGLDVLRYDRSVYDGGVQVDMIQGTVQGTTQGIGFFHTIANIEEIQGTYLGDLMIGGDADDRFRGNNGNDTLRGGNGSDSLYGGDGNDLLEPGDNRYYDWVRPGAGDDTVDASGTLEGYLDINHSSLFARTGLAVTVNMPSGTAQIGKGIFGITTVQSANTALLADGLGLWGSDLDDSFNLTLTGGAWAGLHGGRGNDTYTLTADAPATVRLTFWQSNGFERATQGASIDLAAGVVANDGFGGRDTIVVTGDVQIELRGTRLNDSMTGSAGNDRFIGEGGQDTIDGGAGIDLLRFDRSDIDAGVRVDTGAGTATGVWHGAAFTTRFTDIEAVRGTYDHGDRLFGDAGAQTFDGNTGADMILADGALAWHFGMDIANQVYRLYQATLNRAPDVAGHAGWAEQIYTGQTTLPGVAAGFVGSTEFQNVYGALGDPGFVELLYRNVLGRGSDAEGLQGWLDAMAAGTSRANVVLGFSQSVEFVNATTAAANAMALGSDAAGWSDDVYRLYQATLARDPDAAGLTGWSDVLASGTNSLSGVAAGFVGSTEFQNVYGALGDPGFVELLYRNVLGRGSDAEGRQGWLDAMATGTSRADVVLGFSQSVEFVNATEAGVTAWMRAQGPHDRIEAGGGIGDVVAGGMFSDTFVFAQQNAGSTVVRDLESWDRLEFTGFGYTGAADLRAHLSQRGNDAVFADQGVEVVFEGTALATLSDDMFELGLAGGVGA